ncbi:hypothetical protein T439DRAFT_376843 [Meredithblackwellia eburnea MCA 4105]
MLTPPRVFAFVSFSALVSAQSFAISGPGRFPCSAQVNGNVVADPTQCTYANMYSNQACAPDPGDVGTVDTTGGFKNFGAVPTSAVCAQDPASGYYFCGYAGATCMSDLNCDNGSCLGGLCSGHFGDACSKDSQCLGNIYCLNPAGGVATGTCGGSGIGGNGALCDDGCAAGNFLCASNLCDGNTGSCFPQPTSSGDCWESGALTSCLDGAALTNECCSKEVTQCEADYVSNQQKCYYYAQGTCSGSTDSCCSARYLAAFPNPQPPCSG